eukprot:TRINITY_DN10968_c0_g1_i1.p1 TRINITY_DN10968_c0_g1~~TRINITY_DN10968_c0_g1_i1.p1  ORF type:complete len:641 (-),score=198.53 TRINITY_DN10968_c0_g1_i1:65-1861(-)
MLRSLVGSEMCIRDSNTNMLPNDDSFLGDDSDCDGSYMIPPTTTDEDGHEHHHPAGIHIPALSLKLNNNTNYKDDDGSAPPTTGSPRTPRLASSRGGGIPSVVPVGVREVAFMDNAASALVAAALLHPEDVSKMVELSRTDDADEEDHHNNNSPHPVNNNDDDATSPAAAFKIAEIEERLVDETLLGLQGWWRGRVLWTPLSCRHNGIARRGVTLADGTVVVGGTVAPTCTTPTVVGNNDDEEDDWMLKSFRHTPLPSISSSTPSSDTSDDDSDEENDNKIVETGKRRRIVGGGGGPLDNVSSNDSVTSLEEALGGTTKALLAKTNSKLLRLQADSHMEPVMLFDNNNNNDGEGGDVIGTSQDLVFFSEMPQGLIDIEERSKRRNRHGGGVKGGFATSVSPPPNRRSTSVLETTSSSSTSTSDSDDATSSPKRGTTTTGITATTSSSPQQQHHCPTKEDFIKEYVEWMQSPSRSGTRPEVPADMLSELETLRLQQQLGSNGVGMGSPVVGGTTTPMKMLSQEAIIGSPNSNTNNIQEGYGNDDDEDVVLAGTDLPARFVSEAQLPPTPRSCLLYTSDAADEEDSVDLGGRRIIKKKKN